jgi:ferredoxin/menaquinone-dependent protoporphyrinogen IX oxidase
MVMRVLICYFSGTGNTRLTAKTYAEWLRQAGNQVDLVTMEACRGTEAANRIKACDLLILGGPIYAGNMPDYMIQWVRKTVPATQGTRAIVFSTSAGLANAHGVRSIGKKLEKKGYRVTDTQTFVMPRNFYMDKYAPTPKDEQVRQMNRMVSQVGDSLAAHGEGEVCSFTGSVLGIDLLADVFQVMAKSMGRKYAIDDTCIGCGKCERNCPRSNIHVADKRFGSHCMMCTRCIHGCPVNAISYKGRKIEQYTAPG